MGLTPRQAATLFFGTSLFGLLTFTSGLLIGVGIGGAPSVPNMPAVPAVAMASSAKLPAAAPAAAPTGQAVAVPAPQSGGMAVVVPMPKAPAAPAPAAPAVASAPGGALAVAPGSTVPEVSVAMAAAAPTPIAVKDFRVGLPLEIAPASPLRGPLVDAALAQPRSLAVTPPAPPADGAAGWAPAAAPAAAAATPAPAPAPVAPVVAAAAPAPSAPPFLYSVQAGSFLIKENAERLAETLNKRGYAARVLVAQRPGEPTWYPVVLTPVSDVTTVARLAQEFSASEGHAAEVVSWLASK